MSMCCDDVDAQVCCTCKLFAVHFFFFFCFVTTHYFYRNMWQKPKQNPNKGKITWLVCQTSCQLLVLPNPAAKRTILSHFSCCQTVAVFLRKQPVVSSAAIIFGWCVQAFCIHRQFVCATIHKSVFFFNWFFFFFFAVYSQPPPPYEATAPPAPAAPAQTPPSRTTPTEPRNYGSYNNSQVNVNPSVPTKRQDKTRRGARNSLACPSTAICTLKKCKVKSVMGHIFKPHSCRVICNLLWRKLVLFQYIIITRLLHNG